MLDECKEMGIVFNKDYVTTCVIPESTPEELKAEKDKYTQWLKDNGLYSSGKYKGNLLV